MYDQIELQTPPLTLSGRSQFAEIARQVADYTARGGKIQGLDAEVVYSSVKELMKSGYTLPAPRSRYKENHSK